MAILRNEGLAPSGCHLKAEALEIGVPHEGIGRPGMSKIDDALGEPLWQYGTSDKLSGNLPVSR
jgi:hypothetical protein